MAAIFCMNPVLAQQVRDHSWTVRQKICTRGAFSWGGGERGKGSEGHGLPSLGNLGAKFSETSFPQFKTYCKIPKISPSKNKLPNLIVQKHLHCIAPPNIGPWGVLLGNCPQIQKTNKQSKNGTVPIKFFICLLQNYYVHQRDYSQKVLHFIAVCIVHSSFLAWVSFC